MIIEISKYFCFSSGTSLALFFNSAGRCSAVFCKELFVLQNDRELSKILIAKAAKDYYFFSDYVLVRHIAYFNFARSVLFLTLPRGAGLRGITVLMESARRRLLRLRLCKTGQRTIPATSCRIKFPRR